MHVRTRLAGGAGCPRFGLGFPEVFPLEFACQGDFHVVGDAWTAVCAAGCLETERSEVEYMEVEKIYFTI